MTTITGDAPRRSWPRAVIGGLVLAYLILGIPLAAAGQAGVWTDALIPPVWAGCMWLLRRWPKPRRHAP